MVVGGTCGGLLCCLALEQTQRLGLAANVKWGSLLKLRLPGDSKSQTCLHGDSSNYSWAVLSLVLDSRKQKPLVGSASPYSYPSLQPWGQEFALTSVLLWTQEQLYILSSFIFFPSCVHGDHMLQTPYIPDQNQVSFQFYIVNTFSGIPRMSFVFQTGLNNISRKLIEVNYII